MRSNPPQKDDDGTRFYELVVSRGELSLCRYAKGPGQPRQIVAAEVTIRLERMNFKWIRGIQIQIQVIIKIQIQVIKIQGRVL